MIKLEGIDRLDISLLIIAIFAGVMLVYEWLSILYGELYLTILFYVSLLVASLAILIIRSKK
ncbi:MAG TPA: hypothetical protein EYH00_01595 [Archaeoglobus profundus]|nr:hypothetical protein [Archaeoglobus profundus]